MESEIRYGRKRSGIKKELYQKIESWLESIDDEAVRDLARSETVVTGGAIASMLLGEKVNDYDIYFKTIATTKAIAEYYVNVFIKENESFNKFLEVRTKSIENISGESEERVIIFVKSDGVVNAEKRPEDKTAIDKKYFPVFMSQNAITLSGSMQLVIRFYGEPDKIHSNYDFLHATCYWDHAEKILELPAAALESLMCRSLEYRGSLYPVASMFRAKKFIERGWRITAGQQLKIMWQISELDLRDIEVLREQLTGVDVTYMYLLIDALDGVDPGKLTSNYVGKVIDKIFE